MNLTYFFALLGGLIVLAFVANRLARRTRVPDVLVVMAMGVLLGPVLHWVDAARFTKLTHGVGTLALILILFEAGLELDFRDTLRHFPGGVVLAFLSFGLSLGAVTIFSMQAMGVQRTPALLVGGVMACISSSVLLPVLQQLELQRPMKVTLVVEASLSDALGVLIVGVLLDFAGGRSSGLTSNVSTLLLKFGAATGTSGSVLGGVAASFAMKLLLSLTFAFLAGVLWARLLPILSEQRFWQALTFAAVLLVYAGSDAIGGSSLFTVIAFGATLANFPGQARGAPEFAFVPSKGAVDPQLQLLSFHSELAFLVRTFFFVLLGSIIEFKGFRKEAIYAAGIVGALFLARVAAVQISRIAWRGVGRRDREAATLLIPRGLITAVLALEVVDTRGAEFDFLPSLAFAVIIMTSLLLLIGSIRLHGGDDAARESKGLPVTPPNESQVDAAGARRL
jgi:potassium/hydrogen antiporter